MPESRERHEPSVEARWLQANWTRETLGRFHGAWIAVRGEEVIGSDPSIEALMKREGWRDPLYALVLLGPIQ
jgi:hypothetical protein